MQDLLGLYPGRCAALTPDAMLCGNTLLTPEAQGALSTHACRCFTRPLLNTH